MELVVGKGRSQKATASPVVVRKQAQGRKVGAPHCDPKPNPGISCGIGDDSAGRRPAVRALLYLAGRIPPRGGLAFGAACIPQRS